ncbi:MAG: exonuclease domain-containing protein [Flavobacteriales bacterium]
MNLNLSKPLCFFDLETTGINVAKDRIVEISILKVFPNGNKESKTWKVNPTIPIPPETSAIHGIYDKDVENEPTFKEIASKIYDIIKDSDLAGFNSNRFDVPLLAEELLRAEVDFDLEKHKLVDAQVIFHKLEPRNLAAAYKFYCNQDLVDAHSAAADTNATYEILKAQVEKYDEVKNDIKFLSNFSSHKKMADLAGFIVYNGKDETFTFGKYKGQKVEEVLQKDQGYYSWIQNADFPLYTKKVLTRIKLRNFNK